MEELGPRTEVLLLKKSCAAEAHGDCTGGAPRYDGAKEGSCRCRWLGYKGCGCMRPSGVR